MALLSRVNHMTLGQVVEDALENCFYGEGPGTLERRPAGSHQRIRVLDLTWDERPWARLAKLAYLMPELLSRDEVVLWEQLRQQQKYWAQAVPAKGLDKVVACMDHEAIAADWPKLTGVYEVGI
ncbi:MAG: hypothetical protein IH627_13085 [Rubrivivax sp.]|nr:hypothetical protein [Rubrivivax sp.]